MRLENFDDFIPFGEKGIVYQTIAPPLFESFTPSRCGILEGIERAAIFAGEVLNTVEDLKQPLNSASSAPRTDEGRDCHHG